MGKCFTSRFFKYFIWLMLCHMCRQILLPWHMLLPMFVADVITLADIIAIFIIYIILSSRCYSHLFISWQMLLPYVVDVKTTIV